MKRYRLIAGAASALAVAFAAQNITFRDKAGNMIIEGLDSWVATKVSENEIKFRGTGASGKPFHAVWKDQGLDIRALRMEGTARRDARGAYRLASGVLSGGVNTVLQKAGDPTRTVVDTATARFDGGANTLILPGSVHWVSVDSKADWRFELRGTSGKALLWDPDLKKPNPIRSAEISGPVTMTLRSTRREAGKKPEVVNVNGKGDVLLFDDAARTITLKGNVVVEGDDSLVAGTMTAGQAVIRFNEAKEPVEIELSGSPGRTRARSKG